MYYYEMNINTNKKGETDSDTGDSSVAFEW